jgi:putative tricarboxylic transport membrane protein
MPGQKFGPAWFPGLIAGALGICGVLLVATRLRTGGPWLVTPDWIGRRRPAAGVATVIAGLLVYILAADTVGFHLVALALLVLWMRVLGTSWRVTLPVAIVATLVIHLAFYKLLRVPLPWGVLERWAF